MSKSGGLEQMQKTLAPMVGSLEAGTFRVYGLMPVRPGDLQYQLKKVLAEGDRLDLVFDVSSAGAADLTVSIHSPGGLSVRKDGLTVKKAARVSFGDSLDVTAKGDGLAVTSGGSTSKQPAFNGPALEIS